MNLPAGMTEQEARLILTRGVKSSMHSALDRAKNSATTAQAVEIVRQALRHARPRGHSLGWHHAGAHRGLRGT